jgi:hypothetical protein
MTSCCNPEIFGADPVNIKWNVVRGDKASLRIEFLNDDEVTYFDISDWNFQSFAYDPKGDIIDELLVTPGVGYVDIIANSDVTQFWGTGYSSVVAELSFDLQVTLDDSTTWTPVIGFIRVLGDVSGGSL